MRSFEEPNLSDPMHDIKGRIAEALIEQLFRSLGWKVMRFGMEHTHPHLIDSVAGRDDVVSKTVRSQPDFIVQKNDGQPFFVEVKYRASGTSGRPTSATRIRRRPSSCSSRPTASTASR